MGTIIELGVETKKAKKETFLTMKALEFDPINEDIDVALLGTRIIRTVRKRGNLSKRNHKIEGFHKNGCSK